MPTAVGHDARGSAWGSGHANSSGGQARWEADDDNDNPWEELG